jgi:hypothetical protein
MIILYLILIGTKFDSHDKNSPRGGDDIFYNLLEGIG